MNVAETSCSLEVQYKVQLDPVNSSSVISNSPFLKLKTIPLEFALQSFSPFRTIFVSPVSYK